MLECWLFYPHLLTSGFYYCTTRDFSKTETMLAEALILYIAGVILALVNYYNIICGLVVRFHGSCIRMQTNVIVNKTWVSLSSSLNKTSFFSEIISMLILHHGLVL